jgi:hypothetical protein
MAPIDSRFANVMHARRQQVEVERDLAPRIGGRGLLLLDEFADTWGAHNEIAGSAPDRGKVVWFTIHVPTTDQSTSVYSTSNAGHSTRTLVGVPLRLMIAQQRRVDSVVESLRHLSAQHQLQRGARLVEIIEEARLRHQGLRNLTRIDLTKVKPHDRVDLEFHAEDLPEASAARLWEVVEAGEGLLETQGAPLKHSDELIAFRRWYLDELHRQRAGEAPTPCPFPARVRPNGASQR